MSAILAIDEGTTGITALVADACGRGYRELTTYFPNPGEMEQDPDDICQMALVAAREAIRQAEVVPTGLGITNQRETVCVWDRATGRPLHRAIVWQDRRTAWTKPADFLAGRRFTRVVPGPQASAVRAHAAEWRRAIATALAWAAGRAPERPARLARRPRRPRRSRRPRRPRA